MRFRFIGDIIYAVHCCEEGEVRNAEEEGMVTVFLPMHATVAARISNVCIIFWSRTRINYNDWYDHIEILERNQVNMGQL